MPSYTKAVEYAHAHQTEFLESLIDFIKIPSVSTDPQYKKDILAAANWIQEKIKALGFSVRTIPTQGHPVIFGERTIDPSYPTILIYGHYDVQPATPLECWNSDPFIPVVTNNHLYGRGASDMKGQIMACLCAVESVLKNSDIHLNIKWLIEGEEEIGSPNLPAVLEDYHELLENDFVFNTDSGMVSKNSPTITYGLRGLAYFELKITGPTTDLHSGSYGGVIQNPAQVLCSLISGMKDSDGKITLPEFYNSIPDMSERERQLFAELPVTDSDIRQNANVKALWGEAGYTNPERMSARPTLDVNGMISGFTGSGSKTIIPSWAMAKISMRLVPNQDPVEVQQQLVRYLKKNAPETVDWELTPMAGSPASILSLDLPEVKALADAFKIAFEKDVLFSREGGSIPIVHYIKKILGNETVLTGLGSPDSNIHGPNENLNLLAWYTGIDAYIIFFHNLMNTKKESQQ